MQPCLSSVPDFSVNSVHNPFFPLRDLRVLSGEKSIYDSRNRLTEITEPTGRKICYEYDANGRRTALKLFNDGVSEAYRLNYTYDVLNRLTRIADSANAFVNFSYDALGRRTQQEYSNGVKTSFIYNDISFLTQIKAVNSGNGVIMQLDYTHDNVGNILSEAEQGGLTKNYSYDSIYQLLGVSYSDGTSSAFSYDSAGNRLSKTENGISTTYSYNNLNQLTQALENGVQTDFVYDLNGNLLQETNANQTMTYGYNFLNKVSSINKVTATENITLSMVYNSEGKRLGKTYSTGESWNYVYDGMNVLQEQSGSNTCFYQPGGLDENLIKTTNGVKEFLINDRINSLRKVTNASQAVTASLTYKPFGELLSGDPGSQHYLYTGREKDFESVYFYRNRTFNPVHGVFQQSDPLGVTAGLNLYSYVGNNPIRLTDPMGLCEVDAWDELMKALDDLFGEIFGNDLTGARNALQNATGGPDPTQMGGGYSSGGGGGSLPGTSGEAVLNRPAISIGAPTPRALPGQMESNGKGKTKYWQYFTKGWKNFKSKWFVKGINGNPPHKLGREARRALNLPKANKGTAVKQYTPITKNFAGPRHPKAQPGWNPPINEQGTGWEYYDGKNFPD